jgi:anti-sigma regulatory factor (Ser/Thr protein kinase)
MPSRPLLLCVPNRTDALRGSLDEAEAYCRRSGVPTDVAGEMRLAIEEILANLIAHAWPEGGAHEAELHLLVSNGELICEVTDDGLAFDPRFHEAPRLDAGLDDRPIGGLGLVIVRDTADRIEYSRKDDVNRLKLWKSFRF